MFPVNQETLLKHIEVLVAACHRAEALGLIRCSSGNLSWRMDAERTLVTGTGTWLGRITKDQIVLCRTADGSVLNGKKPSVEAGFHLGILRQRPEVNVVLHFQSPCATAFACQKSNSANFSIIPEIPYYIGPIGEVPYLTPGSRELADAVIAQAKNHDLVIMRNHGQVCVRKELEDVLQKATFFELACEILLRTGGDAQPIPPSGIAALRQMRNAHA